MSKYIFIISSRRLQERDQERFGVKYLSKKKKVIILDLSNLLMNRSTLIYKKIKLSYIKEIKSYKDLISILKNKENSFALDYTGNSITEIVIKLILVWSNIKLIKYSGGLKPGDLYNHIDKNNKIFKTDQRSVFKKFFDLPFFFFRLIKKIILDFINFCSVDTVMIAGKKSVEENNYIYAKKRKLYTHSYNYNHFLTLDKKKIKIKKKDYIVYVDQGLLTHPDFFIKKREPLVDKNFYIKINNFLSFIEKKYKYQIKIALHPKNNKMNNLFPKRYICYLDKTAELIKDSKHVLIHYSTAVSFGVLFKKPITFLTSDKLNNFRPGAQITKLSHELKSHLINIDKNKKKIRLQMKFNKKAYNMYLDKYIKHPKSTGENSFKYLLRNIY